MKQYLDLLQDVLNKGVLKSSGRENMPKVLGLSHGVIQMDLREGFPLITTKTMFWRGIVTELLWFLRGETNIASLVAEGVNIWNGDAYRWYKTFAEDNGGPEMAGILRDNGDGSWSMFTEEEFANVIRFYIKKNLPLPSYEVTPWLVGKHKGIDYYKLGDLGKVYGHQWRNQNGHDQVSSVINSLKTAPFSRYHIINAWNKQDMEQMALPPCHVLYQFIVQPGNDFNRLDLNMYQRSCDMFLGVPFNLASMALLLKIIAKTVGMEAGIATWIGGDVHVYEPHIPAVLQQLERKTFPLPKVLIKPALNSVQDIEKLTFEDFELLDYNNRGKISAKLFTGNGV